MLIPFSGRLIRSSMTVQRCDWTVSGQWSALCRSRLLGENTCDHWQQLKAQLHRCRLWDRRRAEIRQSPPNTWGGPWDRNKSETMEISSVTDWQRSCSCSVVGDLYSLLKGLWNHRKQIKWKLSGNKLMLMSWFLLQKQRPDQLYPVAVLTLFSLVRGSHSHQRSHWSHLCIFKSTPASCLRVQNSHNGL